jgi:hypothetical protein
MIFHSNASRVLLAWAMAFAVPLCCCRMTVATVYDSITSSSEVLASRSADTYAHNHNDGPGHHQHGDQSLEKKQDPGQESPSDHDDLCGCESGTIDLLLVNNSVTSDLPLLVSATIDWISPTVTTHQLIVSPLLVSVPVPTVSLVRMHCALIV